MQMLSRDVDWKKVLKSPVDFNLKPEANQNALQKETWNASQNIHTPFGTTFNVKSDVCFSETTCVFLL